MTSACSRVKFLGDGKAERNRIPQTMVQDIIFSHVSHLEEVIKMPDNNALQVQDVAVPHQDGESSERKWEVKSLDGDETIWRLEVENIEMMERS